MSTGNALIPTNQAQGIYNAVIPPEGPKTYPLTLDFSAHSSYTLNLLLIVQRKYLSYVQTLFVDNSLNSNTISINSAISGQTIIIPPASQAYVPILAPNQPNLTFASAGAVIVPLQLLNIPMPAMIWNVNSSSSFPVTGGNLVVSSGLLQVQDHVIEGAIVSNRMQSVDYVTGNAGIVYPKLTGTNTFITSISTTGLKALITGSPGWFLTSLIISASANYTPNVSGTILTITDSGTGGAGSLMEFSLGTAIISYPIVISDLQLITKATASSVLNGSVNNAPATGNLFVQGLGGTTTLIAT